MEKDKMALTHRKKTFLVGFMVAISAIGFFMVISTEMIKDDNSHISTGKYTIDEIYEKYPVIKYLDNDLKEGKIDYNDLPIPIQKMVDRYRESGK